jgi:nitroreductase
MEQTMSTVLTKKLPALSREELVRAAILAPSPDNNQPWRFSFREGRLTVFVDPRRELPSDVGSMFSYMALGAAVENACIAGRQSGHAAQVEFVAAPRLCPDDEAPRPVAHIKFTGSAEADPLFEQLDKRCTCRKMYGRQAVSETALERLRLQAGSFFGARLDFVTQRRQIGTLARLVAAGDRIRLEYEPFHAELYRQIRFTPQEAEHTRDGLDIRTFELPPGVAPLLQWLRSWPRMRLLARLGLTRLLAVPSAQAVRASGAIGVLSVAVATPELHLTGGRALQRVWLAAQAESLALHPLGSLPIFLAHQQQMGGSLLLPPHQRRVARIADAFGRLVPTVEKRSVVMLFRLGSATPPTVRSLRRSIDDAMMPSEPGIDHKTTSSSNSSPPRGRG